MALAWTFHHAHMVNHEQVYLQLRRTHPPDDLVRYIWKKCISINFFFWFYWWYCFWHKYNEGVIIFEMVVYVYIKNFKNFTKSRIPTSICYWSKIANILLLYIDFVALEFNWFKFKFLEVPCKCQSIFKENVLTECVFHIDINYTLLVGPAQL